MRRLERYLVLLKYQWQSPKSMGKILKDTIITLTTKTICKAEGLAQSEKKTSAAGFSGIAKE